MRPSKSGQHKMGTKEADPGVWRERLVIHSYDVDFRKRATVESLCRSFLETAWNHAERLGVGYSDLTAQNRLWVLARLFVQIDLYPRWGETLELTTWPRGTSSVFALRDFEIADGQGARIAAGSSSWLVLDTATHRPQRVEKLLSRMPTSVTGRAVGREPRKLPHTEPGAAALPRTVRYSDIDVNQHVNSARYLGWLLDTYSADFHRTHALRALEVNYVGETRWGDAVSVFSRQRSPMEFSHSIVKSDQSEVCRVELEWTAEPTDMLLSTAIRGA